MLPKHMRLLADLVASLEAVDRTLLMFDPTYEVEAIKPKAFRDHSDYRLRGDLSRYIFSILRKGAAPMTTREIAVKIVRDQGLDAEDRAVVAQMSARIGRALRHHKRKGVVAGSTVNGMGRWTAD